MRSSCGKQTRISTSRLASRSTGTPKTAADESKTHEHHRHNASSEQRQTNTSLRPPHGAKDVPADAMVAYDNEAGESVPLCHLTLFWCRDYEKEADG